jgi:hypothetical protein
MQAQNSTHLGTVDNWHPPAKVIQHIVQHAIRNIPNKQVLVDKMFPPKQNRLMGLKPQTQFAGHVTIWLYQ